MPEEPAEFHRALLAASNFVEKAMGRILANAGLTPPQFYILVAISQAQNLAVTPKLIHQSFIHRVNLTETIDRMERDRLVERIPNPEDGRSVLVRLTPHGLEQLHRAQRDYEAGIAQLCSSMLVDDLPALTRQLRAAASAATLVLDQADVALTPIGGR